MRLPMLPAVMAFSLTAAASPAFAHHSAAMFDTTKCEEISGTIRTCEFKFPHTWIWIVAPAKNGGEPQIWGFESPAPAQLFRLDKRWSPSVLPKGQKVKMYYSPLRDGRNGGLVNAVAMPNGVILHGAPNAFKCEEKMFGPSEATRREAADRAGRK